MKTNERLKQFPKKIQEEVLQVLKSRQGAYVELNEITCEYRVSTGIGVTAFYNPWRFFNDTATTEIYTPEEQRENAEEYWRGVDMSSL